LLREDLKIEVLRYLKSYDFKHYHDKNDFYNNIRNNSIDTLILYKENQIIFKCENVQTVSNHPDFDFKDTIREGEFKLKCFVESRSFHGRIHGIVNAYDLDNEPIDNYSMQLDNGYQKGRWLLHDKYSFAKKRDLHNSYSGGCFIMSSIDLGEFNSILLENEISPEDIITGILKEVSL
jgi:hypothetical protein